MVNRNVYDNDKIPTPKREKKRGGGGGSKILLALMCLRNPREKEEKVIKFRKLWDVAM